MIHRLRAPLFWVPFLVLLCLFTNVIEARADEQSKQENIRHLLELTNMSAIIDAMAPFIMHDIRLGMEREGVSINQEKLEQLGKLVMDITQEALPVLEQDIAKLYDMAFSADEIADMLAFYETPTGKKSLEKMPELTQAAVLMSQKWAAEVLVPKITVKIEELMKNNDS